VELHGGYRAQRRQYTYVGREVNNNRPIKQN
jgi:hypothetical protein